jgi:hypothetical protein
LRGSAGWQNAINLIASRAHKNPAVRDRSADFDVKLSRHAFQRPACSNSIALFLPVQETMGATIEALKQGTLGLAHVTN